MNKYVISLHQELVINLKQLEYDIEAEGFDIVSAYKFGVMIGYANGEAVKNLEKFKEVKSVKKFLL